MAKQQERKFETVIVKTPEKIDLQGVFALIAKKIQKGAIRL